MVFLLLVLPPVSLEADNASHGTEAAETPKVVVIGASTAHVALLADAIYSIEGRCGAGQSGESGCFQYLPSTWRAYSEDVAGQVLPQTGTNERLVTEAMINTWENEGISDRGVFLMWNQGSATGWGPGSKDCYAGVNDHGVAYDSCNYAQRGLEYVKEHQDVIK